MTVLGTPNPVSLPDAVATNGAHDAVADSDTPSELKRAWQELLAGVSVSQRSLLNAGVPFAIHGDTVMIAVPNDFTRDQLEMRLRDTVEAQLSQCLQNEIRIAVTVNPGLPTVPFPAAAAGETHTQPVADAPRQNGRSVTDEAIPNGFGAFTVRSPEPAFPQAPEPTRTRRSTRDNQLNERYSFENFVIGSSNRFAHAAAVAVAEAPGQAYNPLMIYGDSGLGKTHLLHALGHYVRNYYDINVRYVSTEELTNDFINAVAMNSTARFRSRYRDVDVLLIDDVQFLENKIQTQEEFFHTFNTLHNAQKQIVMTSDRPPKALEALEPRLRSRFEMGLLTDVQAPDLETRIAILRKKAALLQLALDPPVLEFIASRIQTNIRELEGALIRVSAYGSLNRSNVDLAMAEHVLKDLLPDNADSQITVQQIMSVTADYFSVGVKDLTSASRTQPLATTRQIAMYLCRELTGVSLPKIGQAFGGRDHTTVMHADRKVRQMLSERREVFNQVAEVTNRIRQQAQHS